MADRLHRAITHNARGGGASTGVVQSESNHMTQDLAPFDLSTIEEIAFASEAPIVEPKVQKRSAKKDRAHATTIPATSIAKLYRRWKGYWDAYWKAAAGDDALANQKAMDTAYARAANIEEKILRLPATSLEDLKLQALVACRERRDLPNDLCLSNAAALIESILRTTQFSSSRDAATRSDPVAHLIREHAAVHKLASMAADQKEEDLHSNRISEIECLLATRRATSAEGALAALLFLRTDLEEFCSASFNDHQWDLYRGLIDSAVGALRGAA